MNRLFLLLFGAMSLVAHAQVPNYVPTDGLVAWYPFNGNGMDTGPLGLNGINHGALATDSRNGDAGAAILLDGSSHIDLGDSPLLNPQEALTFSSWFRLDAPNTQPSGLSTILGRNKNQAGNPYCYSFGIKQAEDGFELRFGLENDASGAPILDFDTPADITLAQWHHYAANYDSTTGLMKVYLDGTFVSEWDVGPIEVNQILTPTLIGYFRPNGDHSFTGSIDELGIWSRALEDTEVLTLYLGAAGIPGCTDPTACNFNVSKPISNDGTCASCETACHRLRRRHSLGQQHLIMYRGQPYRY